VVGLLDAGDLPQAGACAGASGAGGGLGL